LELEDDFEIVGTAENGLQALEMTGRLKPDIVLMDIRMPEMDGVESTRLIKKDYPDTIVIILTTFNEDEYIIQALSHGASGYLLKDIQGDRLIRAIRDAADGTLLMPAPVAAKLASKLSGLTSAGNRDSMDSFLLSERETEIAGYIVEGLSNRQIAAQLFITEGTVKNYISGIYSKIGINDRNKAIDCLKDCLPAKNSGTL
jgi:DNA-binding NarL/FixJ family response regulator